MPSWKSQMNVCYNGKISCSRQIWSKSVQKACFSRSKEIPLIESMGMTERSLISEESEPGLVAHTCLYSQRLVDWGKGLQVWGQFGLNRKPCQKKREGERRGKKEPHSGRTWAEVIAASRYGFVNKAYIMTTSADMRLIQGKCHRIKVVEYYSKLCYFV